jgi:hypothetical protein
LREVKFSGRAGSGRLQPFQPGIVGLLGFLGVMATLWWNGHLARTARRETIEHTRTGRMRRGVNRPTPIHIQGKEADQRIEIAQCRYHYGLT